MIQPESDSFMKKEITAIIIKSLRFEVFVVDFFYSQDNLSTMEWTMRAIITFFFMVLSVKVMGQRAISQLRLLDFIMALMLGNIIAHPLSDHSLGMQGSIVTTIVLLVLYISGVIMSLKWTWFRKLLEPTPYTLIKEGEIYYRELKRARISIDFLLAELRKDKVEDIKKVALALWECDGKLSIFLDPQYAPITPSTYQMKTEPFDLPKTIILEGKINLQELQRINKEEGWLINSLKNQHQTEIENVLLATVDSKNNLKVFLYN
jgi:uncharacterized membrane protein YcaP (DUF421 family)